MWWLLTTMCFVHIFGNTFCSLGEKPVNPEALMNTIISHWGYPSEMYEVVTEDGYILAVSRIPCGKKDSNSLAQKPVVYLQHGLLVDDSIWVSNLPNSSLGFILADAGYDVWMGNSRGSTWSRKHIYLDTESKEFWAFSYDELIKYDLPATIDFIVKKTGQKQIYYVGHSQGTLLAFGAFSRNPQLAKKIKIYFALAPFATVEFVTGVARTLAYMEPTEFKILFGEKAFLPNSYRNNFSQHVCNRLILGTACNLFLAFVGGYDPKNLNESRLDVYLAKSPAGTSVQNMLHYSQAIRRGIFQFYDWGSPSLNIEHYNQPFPPLYNVEDMKVPTAMWSGGQDILADPIDVKNLEPKISNLIYHKKIPHYNHFDFVVGLDVYYQSYIEILQIMNEAP